MCHEKFAVADVKEVAAYVLLRDFDGFLSHSNFFHDTSPKTRETKEIINLWDFIKIKSFCTGKETVQKTKRQPMEWKNIVANDTTDKGLVSKIYKELLKQNTKKTKKQIKKWAEDIKRHFSNEDIKMANRTHEKMFKIISHQGNSNQNHTEIPPYAS